MKIVVSVHDFSPLLRCPSYIFRHLRAMGVDGIELQLGPKSRWLPKYYRKLANRHQTPILSVHQPLWSAMGAWLDAGFLRAAKEIGAEYVTCHPLPKVGLRDDRMLHYLDRLANLQSQTGVKILLENMPAKYSNALLRKFFPLSKQTGSVAELHDITSSYGLGLTLDVDHTNIPKLHEEPWLKQLLPSVCNIHVSSFSKSERHLPLFLGDFQAENFFKYLRRAHYQGQLTIEVNYPHFLTFTSYDFLSLEKSISIIRQY